MSVIYSIVKFVNKHFTKNKIRQNKQECLKRQKHTSRVT